MMYLTKNTTKCELVLALSIRDSKQRNRLIIYQLLKMLPNKGFKTGLLFLVGLKLYFLDARVM